MKMSKNVKILVSIRARLHDIKTFTAFAELMAFFPGGRVPLLEGLPYQKGQNIALLYK